MAYFSGLAEWFGGPHDPLPDSTTLGVPTSTPGISLPDPSTLGHWFLVVAPNHRRVVVQQLSVGVSPGKTIAVTHGTLSKLGYSERSFPTAHGEFVATDLGPDRPANQLVGPVEHFEPPRSEHDILRYPVAVAVTDTRTRHLIDIALVALFALFAYIVESK